MDILWQSTRYAFRTLRRSPGFAAVAVLTLGLGIGACTALYTVVHAVLLAPLPFPEADRLVQVWQVSRDGGRSGFSDPNYSDVRERTRSFAAVAQYAGGRTVVAGGTAPVRARIAIVSRDMLDVLGIRPALGRSFVTEEQQPGGRPALLVTYTFWQQYLGADSDLSARTLTFDGRTYTVVGVLPAGTRFPTVDADLWAPRELFPVLPSRTAHNWRVMARLRDGVSLEQARQDLRTIAGALEREHGEGTWMADIAVAPLQEEVVGGARQGLLVLLGGAALLLLIACANVISLLVTRAVGRQRELAVRAALGAGRPALLAPLLMEAVLLAGAGAALGLVVGTAAVHLWIAFQPQALPRVAEIRIGWAVLSFTALLAGGSAILMGPLAGWRTAHHAAREGLRAGSRTLGSAGTAQVRSVLVGAQLAISVVLLAGAGLITRSVVILLEQDPGFRREQLVTMELATPRSDDDETPGRRARFHEELLERLQAVPGVVATGGVNAFPMGGGGANGRFVELDAASSRVIEGALARCGARMARCSRDEFSQVFDALFASGVQGDAEFRVASAGYFQAMGIPLLRGRLFDGRDRADAPHAAVISESLARAQWPGQDPIGRRLEFGNMDGDLTPLTVVGVVGDVRERGLDTQPRPTVYADYRQRPGVTASFTVAVHGTAETGWLTRQARDIVRELNPHVPPEFRTVEQVIAATTVERRGLLGLLGSFAAAALAIAGIGLYGLIGYSVVQRTPEIGVRLALGARPADVCRLVLGQGARTTLIGLTVGLGAAVASTRALSGLLFGIVPTDPVTYGLVLLLLAGVAAAAASVPARRAMRVDPVAAMRAD